MSCSRATLAGTMVAVPVWSSARTDWQALLDALFFPPWQADALCREHPEVEFFPTRGESTEPAKAVCARCLVRDECLAFAVEQQIEAGVWGGTSAVERRGARQRGIVLAGTA